MICKGYKVVREFGDKLLSVSWWNGHDSTMEYEIDKVTSRKSHLGPLAVFMDYASAYEFLIDMRKSTTYSSRFQLYRCEYRKSDDNALWYIVSNVNGDAKIDTSNESLPENTDFADQVKLTEKVDI